MKNQEPTTKNHHALHPRTSASNRCRWDRPRSSGRRCGSATERRVSYTDDFRLAMTPSRPCCAAWSRALSPLMSSCSERRTKGRTACARNAEGLLEQLAAIGVREVAEVVAVEPEDVEEDDELAVALLEELESRPPSSSRATISPSSTTSGTFRFRSASATLGKRGARSISLRLHIAISPPEIATTARKPSYLSS